jgi:hypothetical protein
MSPSTEPPAERDQGPGGEPLPSDPADLRENELEIFATYESLLTEHYEDFLGPTSMVFRDDHENHSDDVKVNVHLYRATEDRPFLTLATCGMGIRRMNVHDRNLEIRDSVTGEVVPKDQTVSGDEHFSRAELMLYLPEDWDFGDPDGYTPLQLLIRFARFPHRFSTWLAPGHTAANGPNFEPFFEGSLLTSVYFLPAVLEDPEFFHVDVTDGVHLHVLWMQPITVAERHVKRLRGADELNRLLIEGNVIDLDIDRSCTVMTESRAQRRVRERAQTRRRRVRRETPWDQLACEECHGTLRDVMGELEGDNGNAD